MRVGIQCLFPTQDKNTGYFLLKQCGANRQMSWIARKLIEELGAVVSYAVPKTSDSTAWPLVNRVHMCSMAADNARERVRWDPRELAVMFRDCDIVLCQHEFLAIPLRRMFPQLKIVQMLQCKPDDTLFKEAWRSADLVAVQSEVAEAYVEDCACATDVTVWPMSYDADTPCNPDRFRDVDVLFVQRCSSTNYTHHVEFLQALPLLESVGRRVVFTDVTGYLRKVRPDLAYLEYTTPDTFQDYLERSKVVVSFHDTLYGGESIRHACRAGATPVVLDTDAYREMCGKDYPHFVSELSPQCIFNTCMRAIANPRRVDVSKDSYQAVWPRVRADIQRLLGS
jgi:hypothetical protein